MKKLFWQFTWEMPGGMWQQTAMGCDIVYGTSDTLFYCCECCSCIPLQQVSTVHTWCASPQLAMCTREARALGRAHQQFLLGFYGLLLLSKPTPTLARAPSQTWQITGGKRQTYLSRSVIVEQARFVCQTQLHPQRPHIRVIEAFLPGRGLQQLRRVSRHVPDLHRRRMDIHGDWRPLLAPCVP